MADLNNAELQRWQTTASDHYAGTKEQLVAAGICEARWFPAKLIPQLRVDGSPYMGNNGKQRTKRVYVVEGRKPETTLAHRLCADGSEKWIAQIAVDDAERERREQAEREKWDAAQTKNEERRREFEAEKERERDAARPAVRQLLARYPDLLKVSGEVTARDNCVRLQILNFCARSLDVLVRYGLVTGEMPVTEMQEGEQRCGALRDYRSFCLYRGTARDPYWSVTLFTQETPKERKHFPVTEARRLLKQIAERQAKT